MKNFFLSKLAAGVICVAICLTAAAVEAQYWNQPQCPTGNCPSGNCQQPAIGGFTVGPDGRVRREVSRLERSAPRPPAASPQDNVDYGGWQAAKPPAAKSTAFYASPEIAQYVSRSSCIVESAKIAGPVSARSKGTGTVIAKSAIDGKFRCIIITCWHTFRDYGFTNVTVYFQDGTKSAARVIAADDKEDLVALEAYCEEDTPVVAITEQEYVKPGESVAVQGFAGGSFSGVLKFVGRVRSYKQLVGGSDHMFVTGLAKPGVSGGGMFNNYGELVAVCWGASRDKDTGPAGESGGAPVGVIRKFMQKVIQKRNWVGDLKQCRPQKTWAPRGYRLVRPPDLSRTPKEPVAPDPALELPLPKAPPLPKADDAPPKPAKQYCTLPPQFEKKLDDLGAKLDKAKADIDIRLSKLENGQTKILKGQDEIAGGIEAVLKKQKQHDTRFDSLDKAIKDSQKAPPEIKPEPPKKPQETKLDLIRKATGVHHATLVADSRQQNWNCILRLCDKTKADFPALTLIDVKDRGIKANALPQLLIYAKPENTPTKTLKGDKAVVAALLTICKTARSIAK